MSLQTTYITFILLNTAMLLHSQEHPNILLIIADDMGTDVTPGYGIGTNLPNTPNLDKLQQSGLTFTNVWATPVCAATRATILTGKYGVNNGVSSVPGVLSTEHTSIFNQLKQQTNNRYATSVVGKWHLAEGKDYDHPNGHGADQFIGVIESGVQDYYKWNKVENQISDTCYEYATAYFTNRAAEWINIQSKPWMMWLAHVSPHSPYHFPPEGTYTKGKEGTKTMKQFLSMIENLDYEIGRLLDSIPENVLKNTVVIFVGDNGSPSNVLQGYSLGKGTLYQGGVHVPMIISGYGVTRINQTEDKMINVCDLFSTIAHFSDSAISKTGGMYNSLSFKHLLTGAKGYSRKYNYIELGKKPDFPNDAYTLRNEQFKMIQFVDSVQELYDLTNDPLESNNLLKGTLSNIQLEALGILEQEAEAIRTGWSCNDGIKNGNEETVDCGGSCGACVAAIPSNQYVDGARLYPNPFDKEINIKFNSNGIEKASVQIFDALGHRVQEFSTVNENGITISTQNYNHGLYFVAIRDRTTSKVQSVHKIIKK